MVCTGENFVEVGFGLNVELPAADAEALGTELQLAGRFLPRHVEDLLPTRGELSADLHQKGGFSDAGLPREKYHGAADQSSAEDAVDFAVAGFATHILGHFEMIEENGGDGFPGIDAGGRAFLRTLFLFRDNLLLKGVPCSAGGTAPAPAGVAEAAFRADKDGFCFHVLSFLPLSRNPSF